MKGIFYKLFFAALFFLSFYDSKATHAEGGRLEVIHSPIPSDTNRYEVRFLFIRDMDGVQAPSTVSYSCYNITDFISFGSGNLSKDSAVVLNAFYQMGFFLLGHEMHYYSGYISLNPGKEYNFIGTIVARNSTNNLIGAPNYLFDAYLNLTRGHRSTTELKSKPNVIAHANSPYINKHVLFNKDSDSVISVFAQANQAYNLNSGLVPVPYSPAFSYSDPLSSSFNLLNGTLYNGTYLNKDHHFIYGVPRIIGDFLYKIDILEYDDTILVAKTSIEHTISVENYNAILGFTSNLPLINFTSLNLQNLRTANPRVNYRGFGVYELQLLRNMPVEFSGTIKATEGNVIDIKLNLKSDDPNLNITLSTLKQSNDSISFSGFAPYTSYMDNIDSITVALSLEKWFLIGNSQVDSGYDQQDILIDLKFNTSLNNDENLTSKHGNIKVFPNPTTDYFQISNLYNTSINAVELLNLNGKLVKKWVPNSRSDVYNVSGLKGVYIINLLLEDSGQIRRRIVLK